MNYLLFTLLNTTLFISFSQGQEHKINYIQYQKISVSNLIKLGDSINKLEKVFEKADSVIKNFNPIIDEIPFYYYYYAKTYFEVVENIVVGFKIRDKNFSLFSLKVGDSVKELSLKFPISYSSKYFSGEKNDQLTVQVGILENEVRNDACYIIFIIGENQIKSIEYWENS